MYVQRYVDMPEEQRLAYEKLKELHYDYAKMMKYLTIIS